MRRAFLGFPRENHWDVGVGRTRGGVGGCRGVPDTRPGLPVVATFAASAGRPWRVEWVQPELSTA